MQVCPVLAFRVPLVLSGRLGKGNKDKKSCSQALTPTGCMFRSTRVVFSSKSPYFPLPWSTDGEPIPPLIATDAVPFVKARSPPPGSTHEQVKEKKELKEDEKLEEKKRQSHAACMPLNRYTGASRDRRARGEVGVADLLMRSSVEMVKEIGKTSWKEHKAVMKGHCDAIAKEGKRHVHASRKSMSLTSLLMNHHYGGQDKGKSGNAAASRVVASTSQPYCRPLSTSQKPSPPVGEKMKEKTCSAVEERPPAPGKVLGEEEKTSTEASRRGGAYQKSYREHRVLGWSQEQLYRVVSDVQQYCEFLPWCVSSDVHILTPIDRTFSPPKDTQTNLAAASSASSAGGAAGGTGELFMTTPCQMTATLTVGFSFLKEAYTSRVHLEPCQRVVASLDDPRSAAASVATSAGQGNAEASGVSGKGESKEKSGFLGNVLRRAAHVLPGVSEDGKSGGAILRRMQCEWVFLPVPGKPNSVEVKFFVGFDFKHPMYAAMIMSNIVSLMTGRFETRCEKLYGPPSHDSYSLP